MESVDDVFGEGAVRDVGRVALGAVGQDAFEGVGILEGVGFISRVDGGERVDGASFGVVECDQGQACFSRDEVAVTSDAEREVRREGVVAHVALEASGEGSATLAHTVGDVGALITHG